MPSAFSWPVLVPSALRAAAPVNLGVRPSQMNTYATADLRIPEAKLYADLLGVQMDLQKSREYCEQVAKEWNKGPSMSILIIEALSIAATVSYARAFSGGVRQHITEDDLVVLTESQKSVHEFIRLYRDKHVAHSVNEFEDNVAKAQYCIETVHEHGFTAIAHSSSRILTLGGREISGIIEITKLLEQQVALRLDAEREKLLKLVRSMSIEEVLRGGNEVFNPRLSKVAARRKH